MQLWVSHPPSTSIIISHHCNATFSHITRLHEEMPEQSTQLCHVNYAIMSGGVLLASTTGGSINSLKTFHLQTTRGTGMPWDTVTEQLHYSAFWLRVDNNNKYNEYNLTSSDTIITQNYTTSQKLTSFKTGNRFVIILEFV